MMTIATARTLKVVVNLEPAATPFWKERQLRLCRDLGVTIACHGNPVRMWVWVDQDGQKALEKHPEVVDFVFSMDQSPESPL